MSDNYEYKESGNFYTRATVHKYDQESVEWARSVTGLIKPRYKDFKSLGLKPYESIDGGQPGNLLLNAGIDQMETRLIAAEQVWDATHAGLAVGDSITAAAATQTDLQAATNKRYNQLDSDPTQGTQALTMVATFSTAEANFAWEEWGAIIPDTATTLSEGSSLPSNYILLNRKVTSLGTKTSSQSWVFTVTITIA